MPEKAPLITYIKKTNNPIFTTRELSYISHKSVSAVTQALNTLERQGVVDKLYRGIWSEKTHKPVSPYMLVPHLIKSSRIYVSFLSALHLHGIIEQIPQTITLAATTHTKKIQTKLATFQIHQISPDYLFGFDWYKESGSFLIAEPEKAFADCLYLFTKKKKQYGYFPELNLSKPFDIKKAESYILKIHDSRARALALKRFKEIIELKVLK
ncbi:MAG TPA: hypothetical protein DEE98_04885 [Elusimicrobia bacterium]|nr:MAG: hypothetical protein A2278_04565 [Elusimicrobia bacterium RIFOXYA12_FULL_49_49]OGS09307.1 MAG: hypothetical protein A2204_06790 [Elusimicrobia bacterium RIFOXYA1_FULL_47_7]OGS14681.1 MAG: hypothetical protein A2251_09275 [Elusimicrobia bacterium RIFOXYA2_FULL_47_53]OGS25667.1 MAG: hypothetical protein A2339_06315 [Elusimicrobia bacterium RIFOXYB12_FULL_50_12]OGS31772.1 MAG: hypothetical protein A2323_06185 [Elusimicrobia bacterium RIFOXYB2_FULL_46_23]HBU69699.1 hypothetical protein [El